MSLRKERNGIDPGEPSDIAANHGVTRSMGKASFKDGISELPPLNGSNSYPKQGRINFGKEKLDKVP